MAAIPFQRALDFRYGEAAEVAPGVRRVIANNPSAFTLYGTGTYIVGRGAVAVVDPGPADEAHIQALLRATAGETITHMVVTHTHRDHSPGCRLLAEHTNAKTYGFGPHGAGRLVNGVEAHGEVEEGGDENFDPDVRVGHGDVIDGDGWALECVHTPGHTSNHLCFALRTNGAPGGRVLFSGDHVMGWSTSVVSPPDGHMGSYLASLELLLEREDDVYWPTHGPAITAPKRHVRAFLAHRRERERQIRRHLGAGVAHIAEMVPAMYAAVPPELHGAAARSVWAAMLLLWERGEVECAGAPVLDAEFRLR